MQTSDVCLRIAWVGEPPPVPEASMAAHTSATAAAALATAVFPPAPATATAPLLLWGAVSAPALPAELSTLALSAAWGCKT